MDLLDFNAQESLKSTENLVLELGLDPDEKTATRKDDHEDFGGLLHLGHQSDNICIFHHSQSMTAMS